MKKNPKTDETSTINGETRQLGFGEFADWPYADALMRKQCYVQFLLGETEVRWPEKKRFIDRILYKAAGIATDVNTGSVELEAQNMPAVGEEFGFLVISWGGKRKAISTNVIDGWVILS